MSDPWLLIAVVYLWGMAGFETWLVWVTFRQPQKLKDKGVLVPTQEPAWWLALGFIISLLLWPYAAYMVHQQLKDD